MQLDEIWVYPVKSLPGIPLDKAEINARGLKWDRHWMLIDEAGNFLSQRKLPKMALIQVSLIQQGVQLSSQSQGVLELAFGRHSGQKTAVTVWQDQLSAYHVEDAADEWLSAVLQQPVRLVCMADDVTRQVDQGFAEPFDQTGFADGFPFLLLGKASIEDLNRRINDPATLMTVKRFRPNLVVTGSRPYEEDDWKSIQIGAVGFRVVKPCSRCTITTVDPETAMRGAEPLKTLSTYRQKNNRVYFGQNLLHDATGRLSVGDELRVLSS